MKGYIVYVYVQYTVCMINKVTTVGTNVIYGEGYIYKRQYCTGTLFHDHLDQ